MLVHGETRDFTSDLLRGRTFAPLLLGRLLPGEPFLEFENGPRVQSLDVSSEIDETLPLAEAPGEAAQSASKGGAACSGASDSPRGGGRLAVARLRCRC